MARGCRGFRYRNLRMSSLVALLGAAAVGIAGCSGGSKHDSVSSSSRAICDGAFDQDAAHALRKIGGKGRFEEASNFEKSAKSSKFTFRDASRHLYDAHSDYRYRCIVYKAGDTSGQPLVDIDYAATNYSPSPTVRKQGVRFYPVGAYATSSGGSAEIYFKCATAGAGKRNRYMGTSVVTSDGQGGERGSGKELLVILNSFSRHLADQLGCADDAKLPIKIPSAAG